MKIYHKVFDAWKVAGKEQCGCQPSHLDVSAMCSLYDFEILFYFVMFVLSFLCLLAWLAHVSILPIEHITLEYKLTHSMHFGCFYLLLDYTKRPVTKGEKMARLFFFASVTTYYFYFFSVLLFHSVLLWSYICIEWALECARAHT